MHTMETMRQDLAGLGCPADGTVLIHSSMRSIGPVDGGADAVLDAWMGYFAQGVLALPGLTWHIAAEPDPVFDIRRTAPSPGVGILPRLFRPRSGVVRSMHPTHSLCAFGENAAAFVAQTALSPTPCGMTTPWRKLYERDATILMVGCTLTSCTFLHAVEEWLQIPGRLDPPVRFMLRDAQGAEQSFESAPHKGTFSEHYWRIEPQLRAGGAIRDGRFGDAPVMVLSAKKVMEIAGDELRRDPTLFS